MCTDPKCTITGAFSLPLSPPASLFPPLSSNLSYTTPRALQVSYSFKTWSSSPALKLCCTFFLTPSSAAHYAAEKVLISLPLIAVLTQFSVLYFLDASVGHSAGFMKLGWQFAETTGANFARVITQLHVQSHKPCAQVNNSTSAGPL